MIEEDYPHNPRKCYRCQMANEDLLFTLTDGTVVCTECFGQPEDEIE